MPKTGQKLVHFDLDEVEKLAARGLNKDQIAYATGHSPNTLLKYRKENAEIEEAIKRGRAKGIKLMTNALFEQGLQGNTSSAIFWLKNNAGWRDKVEHSGDPNRPIVVKREIETLEKAIKVLEDAGIEHEKL